MNEVLNILKAEKEHLRNAYGVEEIALFGSYAKNTANKGSDVDLLIKFKHPSYNALMDVYLYLEKKLNRKVDIICKHKFLSKRFFETIQNELIYA